MHFYAWERGLKTGMYYLRTRPAADPIKFTVDMSKLRRTETAPVAATEPEMPQTLTDEEAIEYIGKVCNLNDPNCESCSA